jgi:RNA polymerase sigma-70 factor (ECF subfamily)
LTASRSIRLSSVAAPDDLRWLAAQAEDGTGAQMRSDQVVNQPWEEHLDVVYRYALRLTRDNQLAQEIAQETMLRAWRGRAALREPAAARVWLLRIATNTWTDWLRRRAHEPQLLLEQPPSRDPTNTETLIHQEHLALALAALDELPERQRQVMHLVTVEQLEQSEVAKILGISPAAVKSNLSAGRKQLRQKLSGVYEDLCGKKPCRSEK